MFPTTFAERIGLITLHDHHSWKESRKIISGNELNCTIQLPARGFIIHVP